MGCFNGTCAVTHTAIRPGQEVVGIIASKYAKSTYDAMSRWASAQIRHGYYDDYGWIEGNEGDRSHPNRCLVHKQVWDDLSDGGDVFKFFCNCFTARIELFVRAVLGAQHVDDEELDMLERVISLKQAMIENHRAYLVG